MFTKSNLYSHTRIAIKKTLIPRHKNLLNAMVAKRSFANSVLLVPVTISWRRKNRRMEQWLSYINCYEGIEISLFYKFNIHLYTFFSNNLIFNRNINDLTFYLLTWQPEIIGQKGCLNFLNFILVIFYSTKFQNITID